MPPPVRQMAELGDALRGSLGHEEVSTDLALRRQAEQLPVSSTMTVAEPRLLSRGSAVFTHSNLSPFRNYQPPLRSPSRDLHQVASTPSLADAHSLDTSFAWIESAPSQVSEAAEKHASRGSEDAVEHLEQGSEHVAQQQPNVNEHFQNYLVGPDDPNLWKVPALVEPQASPWFDAAYSEFIRNISPRRTTWKYPVKKSLSRSTLQAILDRTSLIFSSRAKIYKLRFTATTTHGQESGEVLARYFQDGINEDGIVIPEKSLAVYQMSDRRDRLAFLGIYHCPRTLFAKIQALETIKTARVATFQEGIYLWF